MINRENINTYLITKFCQKFGRKPDGLGKILRGDRNPSDSEEMRVLYDDIVESVKVIIDKKMNNGRSAN